MNRSLFFLAASSMLLFTQCSSGSDSSGQKPVAKPDVLSLVDPAATAQTRALYANLWQIQKQGTLFGHHDYAAYGVGWRDIPGKSDVKDVCGEHPAVFSTDLSGIEQQHEENVNGIPVATLVKLIKEVHGRGGVTMMCWHQDNPKTGGKSTDNTPCVSEILTEGSELNIKYKGWLDNIAGFFNSLRDDQGRLIPVLFRPLHEHTQVWSWWGSSATSDDEFIAFWRFIVTYLRDTRGVHNLIYVISPQMDENYASGTAQRLQFRWPGDGYVDYVGMDCYHYTNTSAFNNNLYYLSKLCRSIKKPGGVTECGIEKGRQSDYWTKLILAPLSEEGVFCSMICMWRNESTTHAHGPYPADPSAPDFVRMYQQGKRVFFEDELPAMYMMPEGVSIE